MVCYFVCGEVKTAKNNYITRNKEDVILYEDLLLYLFFRNSEYKVRIHNSFAHRKTSFIELAKIACRLRNLRLIDTEFTQTGGLRAQLTRTGLMVVEKLIIPHRNNIFPALEHSGRFMLMIKIIETRRLKKKRKPYRTFHQELVRTIGRERDN